MDTAKQGMEQTMEKPDVVELLVKLLYQQNMREQAQDFKEVFQCVVGMQVQMGILTNELREVREQLIELQQYQPKEVTKDHINGIDQLQEKTKGLSEHLMDAKERLVKTASKAVDTFKTKGKAAMCKILQKGIDAERSVLTKCRTKMVDVMTDYGKTADRIDNIGNEIKQVGRSVANVGRLLTGKEAKEVSREEPGIRFTRAINKPIRKAISGLGKNIDRIDQAFEKLDKMSERLHGGKETEKDEKPSVKEKLSEMQAKVDEQKKEPEPDKEKAKGKEECL